MIYPNHIDVFNPTVYDPPNSPGLNPYVKTDMNPDPYKDNPYWVYSDIDGDGVYEATETSIEEPQWDKNGWITAYLTYSPLSASNIPADVSDNALFDLVASADKKLIHFDEDEAHKLTFAALLDSGSLVFQKQMRVINRTIERKTVYTMTSLKGSNSYRSSQSESSYMKTAIIELKFRRIASAGSASAAPLLEKIAAEIAIANSSAKTTARNGGLANRLMADGFLISRNKVGISAQIMNMYYEISGNADTDLNYQGHIRYDSFADLPAKDFIRIFGEQIDNGYKLKKTKWYKKALVILIDIIVVVVIIILVVTGQVWAVSLALALGQLIQGQLAAYWAKNGDYSAAIYAGKHAQFLSTAARIYAGFQTFGISEGLLAISKNSKTGAKIILALQIVLILYGMYSSDSGVPASEGTTGDNVEGVDASGAEAQPGNIAPEPSVLDNIITMYNADALGDLTIENIAELSLDATLEGLLASLGGVNTGNMMHMSLQLVNALFTLYQSNVDPSSDIQDKQKQLDASNKALDESNQCSAETIDAINKEFSDPYSNVFDFNEKMQGIPDMMTVGKNRNLMDKYYTSGF
jgi:hypothetical protein